MANGYTCCIDYERLNVAANKLESIDDCLNSRDFSSTFADIEDELKNINFEHNNCLTYKDDISTILSRIVDIRKSINDLSISLKNTITTFSNDEELDKNDLRKLSSYYSNTTSNEVIEDILKTSPEIRISNSIKLFENNIDESIKDYVSNNTLTDYPSKYNSLSEWYQDLHNKYDNYHIEEYEKEDFIDKDMAIWRQEQTGSRVTSVVTSDYAEYQLNQNNNDVAYRKVDVNSLTNDITKIPPVEQTTQQEVETKTSSHINTVPIGLGIAAAGISGSIGAIILDSMNDKKNPINTKANFNELEDYKGLDAETEEKPKKKKEEELKEIVEIKEEKQKEEMPHPYHAVRNKEVLNKFRDDDEKLYKEIEE